MAYSSQTGRKIGTTFDHSVYLPRKLIFVNHSPFQSTLSDDEDETDDSASEPDSEYGRERFAFPELDDKIRQAISEYEAVFPKLNFSSPRVSIHLSYLLTDAC